MKGGSHMFDQTHPLNAIIQHKIDILLGRR